ncbi:MAG: tetratricopeptide repeat protein [Bacteroidia bacterium]|nr:tetratricopeptide repeat protein [Bacteroidia bacterium]
MLRLLGILLLFSTMIIAGWAQTPAVDSLKSLLARASHDTTKIRISLSLHDLLVSSDTLQSRQFLDKALTMSESQPSEIWFCKSRLKLTKFLYNKGKLQAAQETLWEVKKDCPLHEYPKLEAIFYLEGGVVYHYEGEYDSAVTHFMKALIINERLGDLENMADCYNNIANIYWELEKPDDALDYYQKALAIYEKKSDEKEQSSILGNIGLIYRYKSDYVQALNYYNRSLAIDRKYGNTLSAAINLQNIGALYTKLKNYDSALKHFQESNRLSRQIDDQIGVLYTDHGIAAIYMETGQYNQAIAGFSEALKLAETMNIKEEIKNLYQSLSFVYERKNQFKEALEYRKKYEVWKDSIAGENFASRIKEMEVKYETEKKDKQITLLAREKEIQEKESQRQATLKNASVLGLFLISIVAVLIFYTFRQRLKNQAILAAKNDELKEVNFKRQLGELEMKALRAQINPHFLFNCMNSINHMILKGENEDASRYLTKFSKLVRLILENAETNQVSLENELSLLESYIQMEELRFKGKIDYEISMDDSIEPDNTYLPPMVLQPFVENAIWHGLMHKEKETPGIIKIALKEAEDTLVCIIEDNGVGRARSQQLREKSLLKSKSMGLKITEERLRLLSKIPKGEVIQITDLKDAQDTASGTRVELKIPLS